MQGRNRFLNEYESYCIINRLLELNSPGVPCAPCSGYLSVEQHAEAGHAVDHFAGDVDLDLLRG